MEEAPSRRPHAPGGRGADITRPPDGSPIVVRPWRNGWEFDVTPYRRVFKDIVRVTPEGLEIVRRLSTPSGPSDAVRQLPWSAITQIIVAPVIYGRDESGDPKAWWRLRPDWREDMQRLWGQRCRELKQPVRRMPWWGYLWYFIVEGHWRRYAMAVMVFSSRGAPVQLGDDSRLPPQDVDWLCSALIAQCRAHGGHVIEDA